MAIPQEQSDITDEGDAHQHGCERFLEIRPNATYQDLLDAPEKLKAELINGILYLMTRPAGPHVKAVSRLDKILGAAYELGINGPGGWEIYVDPELHIIRDIKVFVPDLAGWKLETMPVEPADYKFTIMPDWVCEALSPSTRKKDIELKLPEYAKAGIPHIWVIDPQPRTLDAYELQAGKLVQIASLTETDTVCLPPFAETSFQLSQLWGRFDKR